MLNSGLTRATAPRKAIKPHLRFASELILSCSFCSDFGHYLRRGRAEDSPRTVRSSQPQQAGEVEQQVADYHHYAQAHNHFANHHPSPFWYEPKVRTVLRPGPSVLLGTSRENVSLNRSQRHRPIGRFRWFIGVHSCRSQGGGVCAASGRKEALLRCVGALASAPATALLEQLQLARSGDGFGAVSGVELAIDVSRVGLDRAHRYEEIFGYLGVRLARGKKVEHLKLSLAQGIFELPRRSAAGRRTIAFGVCFARRIPTRQLSLVPFPKGVGHDALIRPQSEVA